MSSLMMEVPCRLCGGIATFAFEKQLMGGFPVSYFLCSNCQGLLTEEPWWLPVAYGPEAERFDTGKATRCLNNFFSLPGLLEAIGIVQTDVIVDYGGGGGLVARLMRDLGYNCYCQDRYRAPEFMTGFHWADLDRTAPAAITLFEVAEHFAEPFEEWNALFSREPSLIIGSTEFYNGQPADWPYLSPDNGQHVFFYSAQAMAWIASRFGYSLCVFGGYFAFFKNGPSREVIQRLEQWLSDSNAAQSAVFRRWQESRFSYAARDQRLLLNTRDQIAAGRKIVIDLVFFQYHRTGIARLWDSLLRCWEKTCFAEHILLIDRAGTAPRYQGFERIVLDAHHYGEREQDILRLQRICDAYDAALFLSSYYTRPDTTRSLMIVYDLIPEVLGMDQSDPMWQEKRDAIRHADKYVAISHNTKTDLSRTYGIREELISVAYCGVGQCFTVADADAVEEFTRRAGITRPYLLFVGSRTGYKNAKALLSAFKYLPESVELEILFAGGWGCLEEELVELARGIPCQVLSLNEADLRLAYSGAVALVYPSFYEGFGLPIIEAFACGCPVITCGQSSMPEIAGGNALYIDPRDPAGLAAAVVRVCDPMVRSTLVAGGLIRARSFRWELMAEKIRREILLGVRTAERVKT